MGFFKRLIRWVKVGGPGGDAEQFPTQKVTYLGKTADCYILFPYGTHGNASAESLGVMLSVNGNASNRVAIVGAPQGRPQMAAGENCIYHPPTGAIIHFRESGEIDITSDKPVNVTAPTVKITGDVTISGMLTANGGAAITGALTSNGKDVSDTHTHGGSATAPTGPVVPTGVVV